MASVEDPTNNNTNSINAQPSEDNQSKRRRTSKPLPSFLSSLSLANFGEYEVVIEKEEVKDDENPGAMKELDLAVTIKKGGEEVHLRSLTVDQLRKVCIKLNVKRSNLSKQSTRFWIAQTANDVGALSKAISNKSKRTSTACRIINSVFHQDNISEFVSFNNSRSRSTHEVGSGGSFERFWSKISSWVNGDGTPNNNGDGTPNNNISNKNKKADEKKALDSRTFSEEDADSAQSTISERRSPENVPEPFEICFLSYKENAPDNDPYNGHISKATTEDKVDPGLLSGMTSQVTSKEVQCTVLDLLKVRREMKKCMEQSGSHDSNPMNYTIAGIRRAKVSNIDKFSAYYFYMKSKDVPDFDFHFSTGLGPGMKIDSATEVVDLSDMSNSKSKARRPAPRTVVTDDQTRLQFVEAIEKAGQGNATTEACKQERFTEMKINEIQRRLRNYKEMYDEEVNNRVRKRLQKTMQKLREQLGIEPTSSDED